MKKRLHKKGRMWLPTTVVVPFLLVFAGVFSFFLLAGVLLDILFSLLAAGIVSCLVLKLSTIKLETDLRCMDNEEDSRQDTGICGRLDIQDDKGCAEKVQVVMGRSQGLCERFDKDIVCGKEQEMKLC